MINNSFQEEENQLLESLLNNRFFNAYRWPIDHPNKSSAQLELFITSECNLKCSYCYLNMFGKELYPKNSNNTKEIIKNTRILLEYLFENGFSFSDIDLFSGEIWGEYLGNEVMDLLLEYIKKGLVIKTIMIPTNFTFMLYEDKKNKVEEYINLFRECGTSLVLSASIDGKYLEDKTRPFKVTLADNKERVRDDKFYDEFFAFCKKHNYYFHPMVSAYGIEDWVENYKWYKDQLIKHGFDNPDEAIMMLEVRNDDWTEEKIESYLDFLNFLIDEKVRDLGGAEAFANFLFGDNAASGYVPYALPKSNNHMPCSIQQAMTVRLGDLAIVGCHRIAYDKFVYGHFETKEGKITGIKANNTVVATKVTLLSPMNSIHGCDVCSYKKLCMKGCFGAQYESAKDLFMPIDSVCRLFKAKIDFLIDKYIELGVFDIMYEMSEADIKKYHLKEIIAVCDSIIGSKGERNEFNY